MVQFFFASAVAVASDSLTRQEFRAQINPPVYSVEDRWFHMSKESEEKHRYKIQCCYCSEELESTCVMEILSFLVKHKECKITQ